MFRRILYRLSAVAAGILAALLAAGPASAAAGPQILAVYTLPEIIANITAWIVGMAFSIAVLFGTFGAIRRMTANGDPAKIEQANTAMKNAVLGFALAVLAPILMAVVKSWIGA